LLSFRFREHAPLRVYYQTRNRLFTVRKYGRAYPSFMYAESFRFISKFAKIVLLESDKAEKLREYVRGIKDFMRDDRRRGLV
jgi:rhamnosyltransferase